MRKPSAISVRFGKSEFLKINADRFDWRDTYHWVLSLSWPQFAGLVFGSYMIVNVIFAVLYVLGGNGIAEMHPGSFLDGFFFSVETFATVGYGHMYPDSLYGHSIATLEIMVGMFGMAVITGLIFIRFSRPMAKILFSKVATGDRRADPKPSRVYVRRNFVGSPFCRYLQRKPGWYLHGGLWPDSRHGVLSG